jgi:RNA polymerase sigma-70 factor (ECF subfamily)
VDAARVGDRAALDALLRLHHDRVWAVCRRLTGNDTDAADATQDALIAIVRGLPRFDGSARFSTWAYRVAVNATLDHLRRRSRQPIPDPDALTAAAPLLPGPDSTTATRLDVDAALLQIPVDFRAAVVLRDLCGLDYEEIATVLAIPPGTVRSRIARGRAALVPLLSEHRNPDASPDRPRFES